MFRVDYLAKLALGLVFAVAGYFLVSVSAVGVVHSGSQSDRVLQAPTEYQVTTPAAGQSRDDRGCCVIKPTAVKTGWEYYDDWTRGACAEGARKASVNWDFYKGKTCRQVMKESFSD